MSDPNLQFFTYKHLPDNLQEISKKFAELAHYIDSSLPSNDQSSEAIRYLLIAKDCAVRARLYLNKVIPCFYCGSIVDVAALEKKAANYPKDKKSKRPLIYSNNVCDSCLEGRGERTNAEIFNTGERNE